MNTFFFNLVVLLLPFNQDIFLFFIFQKYFQECPHVAHYIIANLCLLINYVAKLVTDFELQSGILSQNIFL